VKYLDATRQTTEQGNLGQLGNSGGYVDSLAVKHKYEADPAANEESKHVSSDRRGRTAAEKIADKDKVEEGLNKPIDE
jgi:hypothetical protein